MALRGCPLRGLDDVAQQHRAGHRSDAPGVGADEAGDAPHLGRDVPGDLGLAADAHAQPEAPLAGGGEVAGDDDAEAGVGEEGRAVTEEGPGLGGGEVDGLGPGGGEGALDGREEAAGAAEGLEEGLLGIAERAAEEGELSPAGPPDVARGDEEAGVVGRLEEEAEEEGGVLAGGELEAEAGAEAAAAAVVAEG